MSQEEGECETSIKQTLKLKQIVLFDIFTNVHGWNSSMNNKLSYMNIPISKFISHFVLCQYLSIYLPIYLPTTYLPT